MMGTHRECVVEEHPAILQTKPRNVHFLSIFLPNWMLSRMSRVVLDAELGKGEHCSSRIAEEKARQHRLITRGEDPLEDGW